MPQKKQELYDNGILEGHSGGGDPFGSCVVVQLSRLSRGGSSTGSHQTQLPHLLPAPIAS
jgi:hypothetical protein